MSLHRRKPAAPSSPVNLKVATQKNRCPRSSSTGGVSPLLWGGRMSTTVPLVPPTNSLPPAPGRSVTPIVASLWPTEGRWCREMLCVAIALHQVPTCQGCGNCDVYFGKKGHYYEMSHCIFLTTVSHKKSRGPCSLSFWPIAKIGAGKSF